METVAIVNSGLTLSSQFLHLKTPKGEVTIDIKALLKEPIGSDKAYFNATEIAKMYGVKLHNIFRTEQWKNYVKAVEKAIESKCLTSETFKKPKLIKTVRGRHHSGTWLHAELVIEFIRQIDVEFAVQMDFFIKDLIRKADELKIERAQTKAMFHPLTDAIRDYYIPNQTSENAKRFAYSSILTLANLKVLGCSSRKYAKMNGIEIENGKNIRDYLDADTLERIKEVEIQLYALIKYSKIYRYNILKKLLLEE